MRYECMMHQVCPSPLVKTTRGDKVHGHHPQRPARGGAIYIRRASLLGEAEAGLAECGTRMGVYP